MPKIHPVEELAQIRACIEKLRTRETELRAEFLSRRAPLRGQAHAVEIVEKDRRILLSELLPDEVLENPYYWGVSKIKSIRLRRLVDRETDDDVIEPFPKTKTRAIRLGDFLQPIVSNAKR